MNKSIVSVPSKLLAVLFLSLFFVACSTTKYLQKDSSLLDKVSIKGNDTKLSNTDLRAYLAQKPNTMMLGIVKFKLGTYSLSGRDTTKFINRMLRNIGEPPVEFDTLLIGDTERAIEKVLVNSGYLDAKVTSEYKTKKRKTNVEYYINSGDMYKIRYFSFDIDDDSVLSILNRYYTINSLEGQDLDVNQLNNIRDNIAKIFRQNGYYKVQKDIFVFRADTVGQNKNVDLHITIADQYRDSAAFSDVFTKRIIDNIYIYCYETLDISEIAYDTVNFAGYTIIYNSKRQIFYPRFLIDKVFFKSGQLYNEKSIERTTANFSSIAAIKYVNVAFTEKEGSLLDCNIFLLPSEKYGYSVGLEANTNSGSTIGAAVNLGFSDKNLFHRAEMFKIDGRISYDLFRRSEDIFRHSISAGSDISLVIPKLFLPYFKEDFRLRHGATTKFSVNYTYQTHPDFERAILNTSFGYQWRSRRWQYGVDLADFSYIKVDSISEWFLRTNPNLLPTFEDHLVLKTVFSFATANTTRTKARNNYSFRGRLSFGGNLFYLANMAFDQEKVDGKYRFFGIPFAQFAKFDFNYSYNMYISSKFRMVYHAMFGIGIPYLNATILPFEEKFFAGGSNSMRGWGARTLGPGSFYSITDSYLSQNGDIKMELNAEARFKLFWVLEGALFIDAGNVWTIKKYDNLEGSNLSFDGGKFMRDIALGYGLGLRFDFNYFLIRFDLGLKLYDPRYEAEEERWAIGSRYGGGKGKRIDSVGTLQFAIGYPF